MALAAGRVTIGFSNPYVALHSVAGKACVYSKARKLARGVDVKLSPTTDDGNDFYADNTVAESGSGILTGGTLSLTVDGLNVLRNPVYKNTRKRAQREIYSGVLTDCHIYGRLRPARNISKRHRKDDQKARCVDAERTPDFYQGDGGSNEAPANRGGEKKEAKKRSCERMSIGRHGRVPDLQITRDLQKARLSKDTEAISPGMERVSKRRNLKRMEGTKSHQLERADKPDRCLEGRRKVPCKRARQSSKESDSLP